MGKLSVLLAAMCLSLGASAQSIKLATGEWAPYTSSSDSKGKVAEVIVKEAFAEVGITATFEHFPWVRAYKAVLDGSHDATFPWYATDKRKQEALYSETAIIDDTEVFFKRKGSAFDWNTITDLKRFRIGGIIGYSHIDRFKDAGVKFSGVKNEKLNFQKLLSDRIDSFPASKLVGYYMLKKEFSPAEAEKVTHIQQPLSESGMYVLFSKKRPGHQQLAEKFEQGLKKLKVSGRYHAILENNGG